MTMRFLFVAALLSVASQRIWALDILTVPIGHPGNPPDPVSAQDRSCCYGSVPYTFRIGTHEITNAQYAVFLNAVAATDTHELYHRSMGTSPRSGILRHGESGRYSYSVKPLMANKPVNWISFWDATRFVNWLNNGQPTGAQDSTTTEDGAYTLGGITYPPNASVTRNAGARWFLPNENEWYKAAYFDPRTEAEGGPPGDDHYWRHGTQSNTPPTRAIANEQGDIINPGPNVVNYMFSADWNGVDGNVTTVGTAGPLSTGFYGTYDQSGNVWEWIETIINRSGNRSFRGNRGGNWDDWLDKLNADYRSHGGIESCGTVYQCFNHSQGFRIALEFSPVDLTGDAVVDTRDIDLLSEMLRSKTLNTAYDLNGDDLIDQEDRRTWVEDLAVTYFGDANLDRQFNTRDLVDVLSAGQFEDEVSGNSTWATGDWNGDREFTTTDFLLVFQADNGFEQGPRSAVASVPEPSAGTALAIGVALLSAAMSARRQRFSLPQAPSSGQR